MCCVPLKIIHCKRHFSGMHNTDLKIYIRIITLMRSENMHTKYLQYATYAAVVPAVPSSTFDNFESFISLTNQVPLYSMLPPITR